MRTPAILVAGVLLSVHLITALLPALFEPLRDQATDRLFQLRNRAEKYRPAYDDSIVLVVIDDASLRERSSFYVERPEFTRLIENLDRAGIALQFHDFVYAAPQDEAIDEAMIEATAKAGTVYFGMAAGLTRAQQSNATVDLSSFRWPSKIEGSTAGLYRTSRALTTFPRLQQAARGAGFLDITVDRDGTYRRAPLVVLDGEAIVPSLPLLAICEFLQVDPDSIVVRPGRSISLPAARRPGETEARDISVPIDRQGRMTVNFVGPWGAMTHYPFGLIHDASDDRFMMDDLRMELEGKLAVVTEVTTGAGDIGPIPADPTYPLSGIHANVMNSILTGEFLRHLPVWVHVLAIEIPLLLLLLVAAVRLPTIGFVFTPPILAALHVGGAAYAFLRFGWIVDIPGPILILGLSTLVLAAYQYHVESKARAVTRHTFGLYFPPAVADKIMSDSDALNRAAQKKVLTILFSDIRSFTQHTSEMEAGHVRKLLNEYFEKMVEIVFLHEGTLDKFIGDGLMVFFNDPLSQPDHASRCARCAIAMQAAAKKLAAEWGDRGEMPLEIRIGIHTGEVVVGNMGSDRRLSYTALGEPVNLTQRLESSAPNGGILISARTRELLDESIRTRRMEPIRVKGIDAPIEVYLIET